MNLKNIIIFITITVLFLSACDMNKNIRLNELDVTIKNSEIYEYNFNILGDEEAASINIQAEHYKTSELKRDSNWNLIYYYQPKKDYLGHDYVEIEICEYRPRVGCKKNEIINIDFTITD